MASDSQNTTVHAIVGGTVVDPSNSINDKLNVFIEHGQIISKSSRTVTSTEGVIDATGCIVAPGFIDMHVHLREPGQEYKEDIESGSKAAAAGGFTSVVCMPNTKPPNDSPQISLEIKARAKEVGLTEVIPAGALSKGLSGLESADLEGLLKEGTTVYSDDGACIQDPKLMQNILEWASKNNCLIIDHAEDFSLTGEGRIHEGKVSREKGVKGISRNAENSIIKRDIELASETGARIHIAHLSTVESVEMIRKAKSNGVLVTCEVTPHHLLLNEEDVLKYGPNALMKPPLRAEEDRQALIAGLADGTIDAIATDHAPHSADEKRDLQTAAFGVIGMETMLPVCLKLVHEGRITIERLIDAVSCAPARILGLQGKGTLGRGTVADITVFDPNEPVTVDSSRFLSKARNCPFNGWELKGRVKYTIFAGKIIYEA